MNWMLTDHRVTPGNIFASTNSYTWVERGIVKVMCPAHTGKKIEIKLPGGPVHFRFQLPPPKDHLSNRVAMFMPYQLHVHQLLGTVYNQL